MPVTRVRQGWSVIGRLALVAAVALVAADVALGAEPVREAVLPNYTVPNLVAIVMCATLLAVPCKRFRRS